MKILPYIFYLLLISAHMVILKDATAIGPATINLSALLVLVVAMYKSEFAALWFGLFAGLIASIGDPSVMGWHALVLAAIGMSAFHAREKLNLDSIYAKLLLMLSGLFIHTVLVVLINQRDDFFYLLWSSVLPALLYTGMSAWLFFAIKEGRITFRKLKAIF